MAEQTQLMKASESTGFSKPNEAKPIFDEAIKSLVVQVLACQIPVGANGVEIPAVTGRPGAKWVTEGERKPSASTGLSIKMMKPYKIACITMALAEMVCVNPGGCVDIYKKQVVEVMVVAFNEAALYRGGLFDTHIARTQKSAVLDTPDRGVYGDLVIGLGLLLKAEKKLNGFVFDTASETVFLDELDANKRPIFILGGVTDAPAPVSAGRLLGHPARLVDMVENTVAKTIGFDGDWPEYVWGVTSGLSYRISTEATVIVNDRPVPVFERNLVATVAETEFAWLCADPGSFVMLKMKG